MARCNPDCRIRLSGALAAAGLALVLATIALPYPAGAADPAGILRFHKAVIKDPQTGLDAYTILVPAGWRGGGRVIWDLSRAAAPSGVSVHLVNPKGTEDFSCLPALMFL